MLVLRHLIALGVSIPLILMGEQFTSAQSVTDIDTPVEPSAANLSLDNLQTQPSVSEIKKMTEENPSSNTEKDISQPNPSQTTPPTTQQPYEPASNHLNPSNNGKPSEKNVSQLDPTEATPPVTEQPYEPAPNYLNPSGNPLLFPTTPSEVDVTIVQPITLNQAVELALRNNRDLQTSRLTLERVRAELMAARADLYPTLGTDISFTRTGFFQESFNQTVDDQGRPIIPRNTGFKDTFSVNGSLNLSYNIYSGGRREANIRRAEEEVRRNELVVEQTFEQIRFDATRLYYELQRRDAQVAIAQAAIEDATQSLRDAQLLEQAGLGTRFSVLQAEVDLATANQNLTSAIADQRVARRQLVELLSLGQRVELTAADEIREAGSWLFSLEDSIVQAYKNRSELEQQLVQRNISTQDRYIALADIKPNLDVVGTYQFADNFDSDRNGVGATGGTQYSLQATVRWTLFDGGRAFARARQADRNIDIANNTFAQIRNQVRREVEQAYYELIANQENIDTAQLSIDLATESLRLARLRFQAGVGTQTDVINSQRDLTDARSRYLQAIVDYNQSLNALQRAVSNLPDNRLFESR